MDAADLRFFEAVARLGGMHKAAQELNTVQSNVTGRIRFLEEQLGLPRSVLDRANARGTLRLHPLAAGEARVDTLFVRRKDIYEFSALRAFMATILDFRDLE
jgi:DNA-binding transcriptional LysR family regulator